MKTISFSNPDITEEDIDSVADVIRSGWLTHGDYSSLLEDLFCQYTGAKYATTVSNCTAGLHLSCLAAGFSKNDEVIVPAQTHVATAHAIEYTGAKPIFVDVHSTSGNLQIELINSKLSEKTKGIIPVHMAGYPCDMKEIKKICKDYDLILIEDCAHAIGTIFKNTHVGNFGKAGCFSFYPTKQITTGEGGIVISNDKKFIKKIKTLKAFGIDTPPNLRKKPGVYDVKQLGFNYRMTDFQAALGVGQIRRYHQNLKKRKSNARTYSSILSKNQNISFPKFTNDCSYFLFQILVSENIDRDSVMLELIKQKIGVSIHYATSVPYMTYYKHKYGFRKNQYKNAENFGMKNISLPVHSNLEKDEIEYVCFTLQKILKNAD
ncbi:MAG: DegT/DnrJ/EryC1/StrS family aminotransferase [Candidatus Neomarinimicrobiota bacterium]